MQFHDVYLIGISLPYKTTHKNNQSSKDCSMLWEKFENEKIQQKIPYKLSNELFAVYHDYEKTDGNHFLYFVGCEVALGTPVPEGMTSLKLPSGHYQKFVTEGPIPDCMAQVWEEISSAELEREFSADFEVYDKRAADWSHAIVQVYISIVDPNKA